MGKESEIAQHKGDLAFLNSQLEKARLRMPFLNERFSEENLKAIRCS